MQLLPLPSPTDRPVCQSSLIVVILFINQKASATGGARTKDSSMSTPKICRNYLEGYLALPGIHIFPVVAKHEGTPILNGVHH